MREILVVALLFAPLISLAYGQKTESSRKGLTVLEFREYGDVSKDSGITVAELVTNGIDPQQYFIVERSQISQVLKEKLYSSGDTISGEELKSLKVLGVDFVLIGSISKIGEKYYGGYRIVNVESGQIGIKGPVIGAKDFQEFVDKVYSLLIMQGFIKVPDKVLLEQAWFEQYKQSIEKDLAQVNEELKPVAFSARGSNISDGVPCLLNYRTEIIDQGDVWDGKRFTAPKDGFYFFTIAFVKDVTEEGTNDDVFILVKLNGKHCWKGVSSFILPMKAGDYLETFAFSDGSYKWGDESTYIRAKKRKIWCTITGFKL